MLSTLLLLLLQTEAFLSSYPVLHLLQIEALFVFTFYFTVLFTLPG